jgi:hypothetical protein
MDPLQEVADEEAEEAEDAAPGDAMSDGDDSVISAEAAVAVSSAVPATENVDSGLDLALARALATGRWTRSAPRNFM